MRLFCLFLPLCLAEVTFLMELCRHGARSPIWLADWDLDGRWLDGPGEITQAGMRQHFLIGKTLRERYESLFVREFSEAHYAVVSTDISRTIMSAESQVMGLFPAPQRAVDAARAVPPLNASFLNESSEAGLYSPLPVYTVQLDRDIVLRPQVAACKKLAELDKNVFSSGDAKKLIKSYPELVAALRDALPASEDYVVQRMEQLLDSVESNRFAGKSLPAVLTSDLLASARKLQDELFSLTFKSQLATKLWSSGFLSELLTHLEAANNDTEPTLFRLYSAHDTTLAAVLSGLEGFDDKQPLFASTLLFEVSDDKTLRVLYNDRLLNLTACPDGHCTVETFAAYVRSKVAKDLQRECENDKAGGEQMRLESHLGHWFAWLLLSLIVMGLFAAASAVFASYVVSKRHLHLVEAHDVEGHSSGR